MLPKMICRAGHALRRDIYFSEAALLVVLAFLTAAQDGFGQQCPFATCGDGSDGALNYTSSELLTLLLWASTEPETLSASTTSPQSQSQLASRSRSRRTK